MAEANIRFGIFWGVIHHNFGVICLCSGEAEAWAEGQETVGRTQEPDKERTEVIAVLAKIAGVLLLVLGVSIGLSILVALIGTAIGLLWLLVKIAGSLVLVYAGYRLLCLGREYA